MYSFLNEYSVEFLALLQFNSEAGPSSLQPLSHERRRYGRASANEGSTESRKRHNNRSSNLHRVLPPKSNSSRLKFRQRDAERGGCRPTSTGKSKTSAAQFHRSEEH